MCTSGGRGVLRRFRCGGGDNTRTHYHYLQALFQYVKLLQPRDAQAWHGAALCGRHLNRRDVADENYGHVERGDFPVTAREWYILAEVQEITTFVYKETVLKNYEMAISLDPFNSIYASRLWVKFGQHGFRLRWSKFQRHMSARGANAPALVQRMRRPLQRTLLRVGGSALPAPVLEDSPGGGGGGGGEGGSDSEPAEAPARRGATAVQSVRNGAFLDSARFEDIKERFAAMRKARFTGGAISMRAFFFGRLPSLGLSPCRTVTF
jgi:hypothetical protein